MTTSWAHSDPLDAQSGAAGVSSCRFIEYIALRRELCIVNLLSTLACRDVGNGALLSLWRVLRRARSVGERPRLERLSYIDHRRAGVLFSFHYYLNVCICFMDGLLQGGANYVMK